MAIVHRGLGCVLFSGGLNPSDTKPSEIKKTGVSYKSSCLSLTAFLSSPIHVSLTAKKPNLIYHICSNARCAPTLFNMWEKSSLSWITVWEGGGRGEGGGGIAEAPTPAPAWGQRLPPLQCPAYSPSASVPHSHSQFIFWFWKASVLAPA